jgi:C-terminal processing protease CtpA/Prc
MKTLRAIQIGILTLLPVCGAYGADSKPLDFQEVSDLIRTNLMGATEQEINAAAAQGLINQLYPKVWLATNETQLAETTNAVIRTAVYDRTIGYIRVGQIADGAAEQIRGAFQNLAATNTLKGLVIDLRFAGGQDYKTAAGVADIFFSTEKPLVDYGEGMKQSTVKTNALALPLALLVNKKTSGTAEAVVGMLRQADIGIAIGSSTAGQAVLSKEFTLASGQHIRVATAPIKVAKEVELPLAGIKPDIMIETRLQDDLAYVADPYKETKSRLVKSAGGATNQTNSASRSSRRLNEAELVRMLREGENVDEGSTLIAGSEAAKPAIQDPVLARALDLLKGLAVLHQARKL